MNAVAVNILEKSKVNTIEIIDVKKKDKGENVIQVAIV
jgi:hypothetical protein